MKQNSFFLGTIAIGAMILAPSTSSASILATYDESTSGIVADDSNHRMENAFAIVACFSGCSGRALRVLLSKDGLGNTFFVHHDATAKGIAGC